MTFLSLLLNSPLCDFLLYDDLLNLSMTNKYTHNIIDNDTQWNKLINNFNINLNDCAKKILQIIKLPLKKIMQILQMNISYDVIITTYNLELRRDYLLSYIIKTEVEPNKIAYGGFCFLIDYYLACEKMQYVYELILLFKKLIGHKTFFSLDLMINEYNQQNKIKISNMNSIVFTNVNMLVNNYINNYMFSNFFVCRIGDYFNDNIYSIMTEYALLNKKNILSEMNVLYSVMIDQNNETIFNFFMGYCYSKMNNDICLEYFLKIDFKTTHFFCGDLNVYVFNEFIKRKHIEHVKTCLNHMTNKNTVLCCEMYCRWASLCFDDENATYDGCMDVLNKFPKKYVIEDNMTFRDFHYFNTKIKLLLKFKKYNEIMDIFQKNLKDEIQMLKNYCFFVLSVINKDKTLNYQTITYEDYVVCILLEKKYKNNNITNTIGYEKLIMRKKIYSKIINRSSYYFWRNTIDDICSN